MADLTLRRNAAPNSRVMIRVCQEVALGQLDREAQELRRPENEYRRQAAELLGKADRLREPGLATAGAANDAHAQPIRRRH